MPLQQTHTLGKERVWAIWHVTESETELSFAAMESCPEEIVSLQKRLEWLAARALLKSMLDDIGLQYYGLRKNEFGKPFLKEHSHHISLFITDTCYIFQSAIWITFIIDLCRFITITE